MIIRRLIIDRGHGPNNSAPGGFDPGATSGSFTEHDVVRRVAAGLIPLLPPELKCEIAPELSRSGVVRFANGIYRRGDVLLSLHMNATPGASGTEVLYAATAPPARKGQAAIISETIAALLGLKNRGAKPDTSTRHGALHILRGPQAPAFMIELGFIDNPKDRERVLKDGDLAILSAIQRLRQTA